MTLSNFRFGQTFHVLLKLIIDLWNVHAWMAWLRPPNWITYSSYAKSSFYILLLRLTWIKIFKGFNYKHVCITVMDLILLTRWLQKMCLVSDLPIKWRLRMEAFSALLDLCAGNSPSPVNSAWPMNSAHKGQWRGALMFSLIHAWTNGWENNRDIDDLRRLALIMTSLYCYLQIN